MEAASVRDTVAYRIVRQMMDHVYKSVAMEDADFVRIFRTYTAAGGRWEDLVSGSPRAFDLMMSVLKVYADSKSEAA